MLVEVKDLDVGDEILIPCQVDFKRLRVERKPQERPFTHQTYHNNQWKSVKCAVRNNNAGVSSYADYDCTTDDYNDVVYVDLNYRRIWLIKKGQP